MWFPWCWRRKWSPCSDYGPTSHYIGLGNQKYYRTFIWIGQSSGLLTQTIDHLLCSGEAAIIWNILWRRQWWRNSSLGGAFGCVLKLGPESETCSASSTHIKPNNLRFHQKEGSSSFLVPLQHHLWLTHMRVVHRDVRTKVLMEVTSLVSALTSSRDPHRSNLSRKLFSRVRFGFSNEQKRFYTSRNEK